MWQLTILLYFLCCAATHIFLNQRLIVVDKKTGNILESKGELITSLKIVKIIYSITWIVSIPVLYVKSKQYFRIAKMVRQ